MKILLSLLTSLCFFLVSCSGQQAISPANQFDDAEKLQVDGKIWAVGLLAAQSYSPGKIFAQILDIHISETFPPEAQIVMSDNFGESWYIIPSDDYPNIGNCASRLAVDYQNPNALYVPTCDGLYHWSGSKWELVTSDEIIVMDTPPSNSRSFWASQTEPGNRAGGSIWESTNSGLSWKMIDNSLSERNEVISTIFIDPKNPNLIYAETFDISNIYLRRYDNYDKVWDILTTPTPSDRLLNIIFDKQLNVFYATTLKYEQSISICQLWRSKPILSSSSDLSWELLHEFPSVGTVYLLSAGWGTNGSVLYAQYQNHDLAASFDGGNTWQSINIP